MPVSERNSLVLYRALKSAGVELVSALPETWLVHLIRLAEQDPRKARIVELRFFGGLTNDESAEVLNVSSATAERDWKFARAWLTKAARAKDDEVAQRNAAKLQVE